MKIMMKLIQKDRMKEDRDNMYINKSFLVLAAMAISLVIGYLLYRSFLPVFATPFVYLFLIKFVTEHKKKKLRKSFNNEFKDFLYSLSGSFGTGRHLIEALVEAENNLGKVYLQDSQMLREIRQILMQLRLTGYDEIKVLEGFKSRRPTEDVIDFVEMYKSCRESGGDFAGVLSKGATLIAEKLTIDREIEAITYQKKFEGRIIGSMPVVLLAFLNVFAPEYIEPLYEGLSGRIVMTLGLSMTIIAFVMIERITEIEI